uniref:Uncharacterized protein n=1 Tax=Chrysolophus pictus TaxID=9089 RepID=A0A8C3L8X5_CHRPC
MTGSSSGNQSQRWRRPLPSLPSDPTTPGSSSSSRSGWHRAAATPSRQAAIGQAASPTTERFRQQAAAPASPARPPRRWASSAPAPRLKRRRQRPKVGEGLALPAASSLINLHPLLLHPRVPFAPLSASSPYRLVHLTRLCCIPAVYAASAPHPLLPAAASPPPLVHSPRISAAFLNAPLLSLVQPMLHSPLSVPCHTSASPPWLPHSQCFSAGCASFPSASFPTSPLHPREHTCPAAPSVAIFVSFVSPIPFLLSFCTSQGIPIPFPPFASQLPALSASPVLLSPPPCPTASSENTIAAHPSHPSFTISQPKTSSGWALTAVLLLADSPSPSTQVAEPAVTEQHWPFPGPEDKAAEPPGDEPDPDPRPVWTAGADVLGDLVALEPSEPSPVPAVPDPQPVETPGVAEPLIELWQSDGAAPAASSTWPLPDTPAGPPVPPEEGTLLGLDELPEPPATFCDAEQHEEVEEEEEEEEEATAGGPHPTGLGYQEGYQEGHEVPPITNGEMGPKDGTAGRSEQASEGYFSQSQEEEAPPPEEPSAKAPQPVFYNKPPG